MIRRLESCDKKQYIELATEFYNSDAVDHRVPEEFLSDTFDEMTSNSPYAVGYGVFDENVMIGYAVLAITYSQEAGGKVVWIEEIYIAKSYRNLGWGQEIFSRIYKDFPDVARFRLEVESENEKAIKLYKKLGYSQMKYLSYVKELRHKS